MSILDHVNSPADVKACTAEELQMLAKEIREALLNKVSQVGGHVGPNLGVTEMTIALHKVFNSPVDKLIWDVSHQTYPHKLLTGRKIGFTEGHFHDITPYSSQEESEHDFFTVGHTSTSVANALGFAKARDLTGGSENIIAILGDGSFSGGLALEALNNAGQFDGNLIIILNDNQMSIAENHGGLYTHLEQLRESQGQLENNVFKAFGLDYRYLEKGNDINELIRLFEEVKDIDHPILLHIHTIKGLGYAPAENDKEHWHWHVPFDLETGMSLSRPSSETYVDLLMDYMDQKMQEGQPILAINAGIPMAYNLKKFADRYPENYWDAGIAEQFTITFGGAAALYGARSFIFHNSTFAQRALDQFIHDLAINEEPAIVFIKGDVINGSDKTHQGGFARGWLSNIPNLIYLAPTSKEELLSILDWAISQHEHPVVINLPEHGVESRPSVLTDFSQPAYQLMKAGERVAVLGLGGMYRHAEKVVAALATKGIDATLVNPLFVSQLDTSFLSALTENHELIVSFEDGVLDGGFGQKIAGFLGRCPVKVLNFGAEKEFNDEVPVSELYDRYHLTVDLAVADILEALEQDNLSEIG
ncbi:MULTISPECIES: 1-deoxy-D-xylulose-5-phosphate synthase [unclassified Lactococcus]|uniref:1-deoxy-D-xylulose-5-phosphate synthase n=1 Tax=unclassified Lactococcus TaxID=2643510 RepID=UPI0011CBD7F4|nr:MULTISPECIES: 1-deoxy-D-xylulose-5-phosphate synthase [unclassified Lactococcus]MQW22502.1 1-deoxy-D-xylulose-5-phosphate synthase [Lactococcus sp. dk101]TXK45526.1 1-deoxy-D-xylulose-5-phosphate synthase [Lactococcus sp. dk310]TXK51377.1 1-deoxy-D-xylulose-5-phosphate synthase [Lactococcus sp. dk322]